MSALKINPKERERAGNIYCSFCKDIHDIKVDAVYRRNGPSTKYSYACESHLGNLKADEKPDNNHMTEADYQTWGRIWRN